MTAYTKFRRAQEGDIAYILAREADAANSYIHRSDEATHIANMGDDAFHYLIALDTEGGPLGYAILKDDTDGRLEWRRVVIAAPGKGRGKAFMRDVLDHFTGAGKVAIWLDVYADNTRARHVYESLGFTETHREPSPIDPANTLVFMEFRAKRPNEEAAQ